MKFRCPCGDIVTDSSVDAFHHEARILRKQGFSGTYDNPAEKVAQFIDAIRQGKRKEWVDSFYGGRSRGVEIKDSEVVFDIFDLAHHGLGLDMYQCDACGRIFIERIPGSFTYRSFKPEDEDWQGTLAEP